MQIQFYKKNKVGNHFIMEQQLQWQSRALKMLVMVVRIYPVPHYYLLSDEIEQQSFKRKMHESDYRKMRHHYSMCKKLPQQIIIWEPKVIWIWQSDCKSDLSGSGSSPQGPTIQQVINFPYTHVIQLAEIRDLNSLQYEFESHRGY